MINLIAACGHDRVIGNKGKLPWTIEEVEIFPRYDQRRNPHHGKTVL